MTMPSQSHGINNACNDNKKASKPLIEKRRRARINSSLALLKDMVVCTPASAKSTSTRPPKLEKADILEMTVAFLKKLLGKQHNTHGSYSSGYEICANEVYRFLEGEGYTTLIAKLKSHLSTYQPTSNVEIKNTSTDDSMSCSSRSQTPSTDTSPMEYSTCSPFTDSEQDVPPTSSSALSSERTFPAYGNESHYKPNGFVKYQSPEHSSASNFYRSGPLDLKVISGDDVATNQVLQSAVNNRTLHVYSPSVSAHNCHPIAQNQSSKNNDPSMEKLNFNCCNDSVWRPW